MACREEGPRWGLDGQDGRVSTFSRESGGPNEPTRRHSAQPGYRLGAAQARVNLAEAKPQLEKTEKALMLLEESGPLGA